MLRRILAATLVVAHLFLILPVSPAQAASGGCAGAISALDVCEMPLARGAAEVPGGKCASCVLLPEAALPGLEAPAPAGLPPIEGAVLPERETDPLRRPPRT